MIMKALLAKALKRTSLLRAVNTDLTLRICGRRVRVPLVHGVGFTGVTEPWMRRLLEHFLERTQGAMVDVGVNLGQTLALVKSVDPGRQYLGFEPNPTCVAYVHELIARNRFENCTIVPAALHREDRLLQLDLYARDVADSTASVVGNFRASRPVYQRMCVAAFRYETVAASLPPMAMGLVKIDVEGAELDVVLGLETAIRRDRPTLIVEILPVYSEENVDRKQRQEELEDTLRRWDYVLLRINKDGKQFAGLEPIGRIGIHGDLSRCDYVCLPRERKTGQV
jgi:FkbM family methyltransferase